VHESNAAQSGAQSAGVAAAGAGGGWWIDVRGCCRPAALWWPRAAGCACRSRPSTLAVFVKLEDDDDYTPVRVSGDSFVGDLKKLVMEELKLEAPPNRVTLTKEGADTPLDSTLTVQEALGGVVRPRLIVKVLKVERAPGAWLAALAWLHAARRTWSRGPRATNRSDPHPPRGLVCSMLAQVRP
jgi:hypothetical protein